MDRGDGAELRASKGHTPNCGVDDVEATGGGSEAFHGSGGGDCGCGGGARGSGVGGGGEAMLCPLCCLCTPDGDLVEIVSICKLIWAAVKYVQALAHLGEIG